MNTKEHLSVVVEELFQIFLGNNQDPKDIAKDDLYYFDINYNDLEGKTFFEKIDTFKNIMNCLSDFGISLVDEGDLPISLNYNPDRVGIDCNVDINKFISAFEEKVF